MERRWGEGGSRDIVEGSRDKGIFVEEAGGNLGSEGVDGVGMGVGLSFSSSMRHIRWEGLAHIQTRDEKGLFVYRPPMLSIRFIQFIQS